MLGPVKTMLLRVAGHVCWREGGREGEKRAVALVACACAYVRAQAVDVARAGQSVAMKIEATNPTEQSRMYGRHFDFNDPLLSRISRESIDALKAHFRVRWGAPGCPRVGCPGPT